MLLKERNGSTYGNIQHHIWNLESKLLLLQQMKPSERVQEYEEHLRRELQEQKRKEKEELLWKQK